MLKRKTIVAALLAGTSTLALAMPSQAQTAAAVADVETITVTGSRIRTDGFEAPTPVTVATVETLLKAAPANLPDALNQLPQFLNSANPYTGRKLAPQTPHGNYLNLRNIGSQRTLIMLDGVRIPPTTYNGNVNIDVIPQMLVQRVEVVTAGASAAYGSDAVAGVANFMLDHDFIGVRAQAQAGLSTYGDAFNYRLGAAGGFNWGERGHVMLSVERFEADGILMSDRPDVATSAITAGRTPGGGTAGTAANPLIFYPEARWSALSDGGHIASAGPLSNIYFPSAGTYRAYNVGTPTGTGGFSVGGDGSLLGLGQSISENQESNQGLVRVSYDFNDSISGYVMGIGSQTSATHIGPASFNFNTTIFSGNAFIPAGVQAIMTANNIASFSLQKYLVDNGYLPGMDETKQFTGFAGLEGEFGDGFSWNFDYAHGYTKHYAEGSNLPELRKLAAAADAVRDSNGNIVCRVELTNPGLYPGCVPYNMMGIGASSEAANNYIRGVSEYEDVSTTDGVSGSVQGDVFDLWAGPVGVAVGAEYRRYKLAMTSNADPAVTRPVTGLRGIDVTASRFWYTNVGTASASLNVKEAFGEVNVPLAKDMPALQSLDVNGAIRVTDYSTSGTVTTWKVGGTWRPIDDLNLRLTRSRDIRAPTLFDLYSSATFSRSGLTDVHTNSAAAVDVRGSGNPNLKPEIGNTLSFGFVFTPVALPAFSLSADFFDLKVTGAIATLSASNVVLLCENSNGLDPICAQIDRPLPFSDRTPANIPTTIRTIPTNSSLIETRGVDLEASYRADVGAGALTARLLASYIDKYNSQQSSIAPLVQSAGRGDHQSAVPRIKGSLSLNYDQGPFSVFVQERMFDKVRLGTLQIYAEDPVPAQFYTDMTFTYRLAPYGSDTNLFLSVNNVFNKKPPIVPGTTAPEFGVPTIPLYDIVGRMFTVGARVNF